MGDLSKHFSRSEFSCGCGCGFDVVDAELISVLEDLREALQSTITIKETNGSGCRCRAHNKAVGGSSSSQHLLGKAADINVTGVDPEEVQEYLLDKYPDSYGIGVYNSFTHIDVRGTKARW